MQPVNAVTGLICDGQSVTVANEEAIGQNQPPLSLISISSSPLP